MTENRVGQTLAKQVSAGGSGIISTPVDRPGTVESLKLRIYAGAENTLHLRPVKVSNGTESNLIDYAADGKTYVDGDDDVWEWSIGVPVEADDEIGVRYDNTDTTNPHNFRVTTEVDYLGGVERVAGYTTSLLGRVL